MKCKFCSYTTSFKSSMVDHIKRNHASRIPGVSNTSSDYAITSMIESSFSSFSDSGSSYSSSDSGFSGGGGCSDGGGSSGGFD